MIDITILSELPLTRRAEIRQNVCRVGKWVCGGLGYWGAGASSARTDGPVAVRVGLLEGLRRIGHPFRFNPPAFQVTPYVGVLSNIEALRWAIAAKRRGQIERVVAGPNLVVTPDEHDGVLVADEIGKVVVPCGWVRSLYEAIAPSLCGRISIWPAGVDEQQWRPSGAAKSLDCLVYDKAADPLLWYSVQSELTRRKLMWRRLEYGHYEQEEYANLLAQVRWMIYLSPSESQGLALLEAWACGVPTLVWDRGFWEANGYRWDGASSAPYLVPTCGLKFTSAVDFSSALDEFLKGIEDFDPRAVVLNGFTQEQAVHSYLAIFC